MIAEPAPDISRLVHFTLQIDGRFEVVHQAPPDADFTARAQDLCPGAMVVGSVGGGGPSTRWAIDRLHRAAPRALIVVLSTARRPGRLELAAAQVPRSEPGWPYRLVHSLAEQARTLDPYEAWPAWECRTAERRRGERRSGRAPGAQRDRRAPGAQRERRSYGRRASDHAAPVG